MAEETFEIALGGRRWTLSRLPWRISHRVLPRALAQARALADGDEAAVLQRLDQHPLEEQVEIVALALQSVDPDATVEALGELHFSVADLAGALVQTMRACGLEIGDGSIAGAETSTGSVAAA